MLEKVATKPVSPSVAIVVRAREGKEVRVTGEFRLVVAGEWRDHDDATERVANPFGSENGVLKVL